MRAGYGRVVVTGMGIVTACGAGKEINRIKILSGESAVGEISSFDASKYRARRGAELKSFSRTALRNIDGKQLDRASHLLIHAAREALLDSACLDELKDTPVLISLGTTLGGMLSGEVFHKEVIASGLDTARLSLVGDYLAHNQAINIFKEFGLNGDFLIFSNACASGTNAIGHAFNVVGSGQYDTAICGGYDTMSEFSFAGFNSLMAVTPRLCMPFDKNRDGLVLGEGAGILILESLERAIGRNARIYGEVAGYGESSDAWHMTSPEPSGSIAAAAIQAALNDADNPQVDYINAHGTGTIFNDQMEAKAITIAFGRKAAEIPLSSIKPTIGHCLGGAGALEAITSLFAILYKTIPPNINYETPDPECALNIVSRPVRSDVNTVLSNSFGFGGSNAAVILRQYR
jgi:3-oxoacyl-[acyl-carrier-protein] synthase II